MDNILEKVESALEGVRPYLKADGGDVKVLNLDADYTLTLEFVGSCISCSMASMTFKAGIEEAILKNVPEIKKVVASNLN
jgi:Fe-S cluster biogenesis protein NfuA